MASALEAKFAGQLTLAGVVGWQQDVTFLEGRRFRGDFVFRAAKLLVEIEGAVWGQRVVCHQCGAYVMERSKTGKLSPVYSAAGRHTRGSGFTNDAEKYNLATMAGWSLLRFTASEIKTLDALNLVEKFLLAKGAL